MCGPGGNTIQFATKLPLVIASFESLSAQLARSPVRALTRLFVFVTETWIQRKLRWQSTTRRYMEWIIKSTSSLGIICAWLLAFEFVYFCIFFPSSAPSFGTSLPIELIRIYYTQTDAVFLSPPWGGPEYSAKDSFDLHGMTPDGFVGLVRCFELLIPQQR
jgi:hypothetical protein